MDKRKSKKLVVYGATRWWLVAILFSLTASDLRPKELGSLVKMWAETGFRLARVRPLFDDLRCTTSERQLRACTAAARLGLNSLILNSRDRSARRVWEKELSSKSEEIHFSALFTWIDQHLLARRDGAWLAANVVNEYIKTSEDPHSYILPEIFLRVQGEGDWTRTAGVGVDVACNSSCRITAARPEGPAWRAGLRPGDEIAAVEGTPAREPVATLAISGLRGDYGTTVHIKVKRASKIFDLSLRRASIFAPEVTYSKTNGLAIIRIASFTHRTFAEFRAALVQANHDGVRGAIIDLRGNGGGVIEAALDCLGLLLGSDRPLVGLRALGAPDTQLRRSRSSQIFFRPLAVIIDHATASAAEIFAGALSFHGRGFLVGQRSFGKATFQSAAERSFAPGVTLVRTRGRVFLPDGVHSHQKWGLEPDLPTQTPALSGPIGEAALAGALDPDGPAYRPLANSCVQSLRRCVGKKIFGAAQADLHVAALSLDCAARAAVPCTRYLK